MSDNNVILIGNLTDDVELRFTPSGLPVANFTVAVNKRVKDGDSWTDKVEGYFKCSCWRDLAENCAESLSKGSRVIATGRLEMRHWEDKEGNKRSSVELQAEDVGPSLRWATAKPEKRRSAKVNGGGPEHASPPAQTAEPVTAAAGGF